MSLLSSITSNLGSNSVGQLLANFMKERSSNTDQSSASNGTGIFSDILSNLTVNGQAADDKQMQAAASAVQINQLADSVIGYYDTDSDGSLKAAEIGASNDDVSASDIDGNGQIDKSELRGAFIMEQVAQDTNSMILRYDQDGDSALTKDELSDVSDDYFSSVDTNGDGKLTIDELNASHPLNKYTELVDSLTTSYTNNLISSIESSISVSA